jgi:drug/metabolite transporter (DMT)-like permease
MTSWKPYAALVGLCFFWGTTYLGIKIGIEHFPPFLFSGVRYVISGAAVVLWFLLIHKDVRWPTKREYMRIIISGLFIFAGGNLFLVLAERQVASGLAALVNTMFPVWIVIITRIWNPGEKTPPLALAGILIAFAGQFIIFHGQLEAIKNVAYLGGILFLIGGVINGSIGSVYMKKHPVTINPVLTGGLQMFLCGGITALTGFIAGERISPDVPAEGWWAMLYLIIAGSIIGYSLFVYALHHLPATLVSVYAYVNPIVALWLGWLILDEALTMKAVYAMLITLAGVYLVNRGMNPPSGKRKVPVRDKAVNRL